MGRKQGAFLGTIIQIFGFLEQAPHLNTSCNQILAWRHQTGAPPLHRLQVSAHRRPCAAALLKTMLPGFKRDGRNVATQEGLITL